MKTQESAEGGDDKTPADQKSRERSPAYPAIPLNKALELAQRLWDAEKRSQVMIPRAVTTLGFSAKSSAGLLAVAAMKKYNLLDDEGTGDMRKVRLTDTGINLLNPSAPKRADMLRQAALAPQILADLWERFGAQASDGTIRDHLVFERRFTEQAALTLIRVFRETIEYAKLSSPDTGAIEAEKEKPEPPASTLTEAPARTPLQSAAGMVHFPVPLPSGKMAYLGLPAAISAADFIFLQAILTALRPGVVKPDSPTDEVDALLPAPPSEPSVSRSARAPGFGGTR